MAIVRFKKGLILIPEVGDLTLEIEKSGTDVDADVRVTFEGSGYSDYFRREATAIKSMDSIGHFFSPSRRLFWAKEEEGIKTVSVNVKSNEVPTPKTFMCRLSSSSNNVEEELSECYCAIIPKGSHITDFLAGEASFQNLAEYGDIDLKFMDWGRNEYPPQLQPNITPEINKLLFQPLGNGIFYITGRFKATGVRQMAKSVITDYNNINGVSFLEKNREKLILPMANQVEWDIPLFVSSSNLWYLKNGNIMDTLKPIKGLWKAKSKEVELGYEPGKYAILFSNNNLTWDIDIVVTGFTLI